MCAGQDGQFQQARHTVKYQRSTQSVQAPIVNILRNSKMCKVHIKLPQLLKRRHKAKESVTAKGVYISHQISLQSGLQKNKSIKNPSFCCSLTFCAIDEQGTMRSYSVSIKIDVVEWHQSPEGM